MIVEGAADLTTSWNALDATALPATIDGEHDWEQKSLPDGFPDHRRLVDPLRTKESMRCLTMAATRLATARSGQRMPR